MPSLRRAVLLTALCLAALAPAAAEAQSADQTAEARRLYSEAKKAMGEKKYKDAALGFEAASKLKTSAVSLYTAAQAWELAGEPARAADAYSLALGTGKLSESQAQRSQERLAELEKRLGAISVNGADGTLVQLDDHMELVVPAKVHGLPGDHSLGIKRKDGSSDRRSSRSKPDSRARSNSKRSPSPNPRLQK